MESCFHVNTRFRPYNLNVAAETKTQPSSIFPFCYSPMLVSLCELAPQLPDLKWSSADSSFDLLCVQKWSSAYLSYNKWLVKQLVNFCHLKSVCLFPLTSPINKV
ncbi:hypothetical protein AMECASPLE_012990 [Ameca splendens]|uniref:Uncharacterized protein n=1 Tax=Ameca splendens TaxID=208324 RepID=A0ABV0XEB9_9TELE